MISLDSVRSRVEATVLGPGVTPESVEQLCISALKAQSRGVCVPPRFVRLADEMLSESELCVVTVSNFPFSDESLLAVQKSIDTSLLSGADEVDVVLPVSLALSNEWRAYRAFAEGCLSGTPPERIKFILETAALPEESIRRAARSVLEAGGVWLKTSTGFSPAGGARVEHVRILREEASYAARIKASGGIRELELAIALLEAGADVFGSSQLHLQFMSAAA